MSQPFFVVVEATLYEIFRPSLFGNSAKRLRAFLELSEKELEFIEFCCRQNKLSRPVLKPYCGKEKMLAATVSDEGTPVVQNGVVSTLRVGGPLLHGKALLRLDRYSDETGFATLCRFDVELVESIEDHCVRRNQAIIAGPVSTNTSRFVGDSGCESTAPVSEV